MDLGSRKLEVTGEAGAVNVPINDLNRYWPQGVGRNAGTGSPPTCPPAMPIRPPPSSRH